jgi:two-component system, sensor histidine kinase and response regulator
MLEKVKVLAVDDIEENLVALAALLDRPALELIRAHSGTEALEALLAHDIALALLDVQMPGMDGFELAELMRGSQRTKHVPIIFLTAGAPDRTRLFKGYDAGGVDFLFKPIDPHLLGAKVDVFVELHLQKRQLANQLEQIQQAQRMSDLFIGVLGHDLRNPLSSVVNGATLLEMKAEDPEETRKKARVILNASRRMERLIQQLLDFALARVKGAIPIEPVAMDLAKSARQVVGELGASVDVTMALEVQGDTAGVWDTDRMMQVISNLVGNALEHGAAESPVRISIDGSAPDQVALSVENTGAIPKETLAVLFSPFKPRGRNSRGLGLGLYIVDQVVQAHGGRVIVDEPSAGRTRFLVRLPRRSVARPSESPAASPRNELP